MMTPSAVTRRAVLLLVAVSAAAAAPSRDVDEAIPTRSVNDGVYTRQQARRGETLFRRRCESCHSIDPFTGPAFYTTWPGPLDAFFDLMRTAVPDDNPGTLVPADAVDLIAYFLALNGYPPGDGPLEGTPDAMRRVLLEPPASIHHLDGATPSRP